MKGFSVQNGTEYRILVEGERWNQGDVLDVEIRSAESAPVLVAVAEGQDRKIRAKSADAFEVLESREGAGPVFRTRFELQEDARITDKSGSLYLLYGNPESGASLASLKLTVEPHPVLSGIRDLLTHHFRFALKSASTGKSSCVEFKLEPSGAKEWASLSQLLARLRMGKETIELELVFHRTVINALKPGLAGEKISRGFQRSVPSKDLIHGFNGRLDTEAAIQVLESVFSEYREQSWLPG
jgi:hypothetical protein